MGPFSFLLAPFRVFLNIIFSAHFRVEGGSMAPTLLDGQSVLVVRPVFSWNRVHRGDVVVLLSPAPREGVPEGTWFIKRVAGMPGEEIVLDSGRLYADDVLLTELPGTGPQAVGDSSASRREWWNGADEYFVLGDNPAASTDSRTFGPVPADRVIGRVWFRVWPLRAWGPV